MTAAAIAQLALATFVVVQFLKFLLPGPASQSAADQAKQAQYVRLFVYAVAVAVCAVAVPLDPTHDYVSALADAKVLLVDGFLVFSAAVSSYHIATSLDTPTLMASAIGTLKPYTPDPGPAAPAVEIVPAQAPEQAAA